MVKIFSRKGKSHLPSTGEVFSEWPQQKVVEGLQEYVVEAHDDEGLRYLAGTLLDDVDDVGEVSKEDEMRKRLALTSCPRRSLRRGGRWS